MTLTNRDAKINSIELVLVRRGDHEKSQLWISQDMEEEHVYLINYQTEHHATIINDLSRRMKKVRLEIMAYHYNQYSV